MKVVTYKCDICHETMAKEGNQISGDVTFGGKTVKVLATVIAGDRSDVCNYCIIEAVKKFDKRPQCEN